MPDWILWPSRGESTKAHVLFRQLVKMCRNHATGTSMAIWHFASVNYDALRSFAKYGDCLFKHFRKLVSSALTEEDQVIGGPGIIVEVDETKLGKRKYQRGHRVEGCWVVVGIERTPEAKVFLVPVEERSSETLTSILRRYVAPHSIVYTDCWKGYLGIQYDLEVSHATVNHSKFFKDPATQVCTNKAEGLNNGLKMKISPRNRVKDNMEEHLLEYVWRKKNQSCLWSSFIEALRDIHYDSE